MKIKTKKRGNNWHTVMITPKGRERSIFSGFGKAAAEKVTRNYRKQHKRSGFIVL